jgi:hypothetical protein
MGRQCDRSHRSGLHEADSIVGQGVEDRGTIPRVHSVSDMIISDGIPGNQDDRRGGLRFQVKGDQWRRSFLAAAAYEHLYSEK